MIADIVVTRTRGWRAALGVAGALLLGAVARDAYAHGPPLPLSLWGDFGAAAARCQRVLGNAATQCALAGMAARARCIDAELGGGVCDRDAEAAAVLDARERALEKVEASCSDTAATRLQFLGMREALTDLIRVCREIETALVTTAYGPALVDSSVVAVDAETSGCLTATARGAAEILRQSARTQRAALDRVAAQPLSTAGKEHGLARARLHLTLRQPMHAARLVAGCRTRQFEDLYGRSANAFTGDVVSRAACLGGGVYVQDAVLCPPARCGNGMQEPLEECDDGNAIDTDWCRSDCRRAG